jgi:hypothetical protein
MDVCRAVNGFFLHAVLVPQGTGGGVAGVCHPVLEVTLAAKGAHGFQRSKDMHATGEDLGELTEVGGALGRMRLQGLTALVDSEAPSRESPAGMIWGGRKGSKGQGGTLVGWWGLN